MSINGIYRDKSNEGITFQAKTILVQFWPVCFKEKAGSRGPEADKRPSSVNRLHISFLTSMH